MVLKQQVGFRQSGPEFENDVKTYGTQAWYLSAMCMVLFENDVKTYGTQAIRKKKQARYGLRMM